MPEPPHVLRDALNTQRWNVNKDRPKTDGAVFVIREEDRRLNESYMYMYTQTNKLIRLVSYTADSGPDLREFANGSGTALL